MCRSNVRFLDEGMSYAARTKPRGMSSVLSRTIPSCSACPTRYLRRASASMLSARYFSGMQQQAVVGHDPKNDRLAPRERSGIERVRLHPVPEGHAGAHVVSTLCREKPECACPSCRAHQGSPAPMTVVHLWLLCSKRDTVGVLTLASAARSRCVSFIPCRRRIASSTRSCQLRRNSRSIYAPSVQECLFQVPPRRFSLLRLSAPSQPLCVGDRGAARFAGSPRRRDCRPSLVPLNVLA